MSHKTGDHPDDKGSMSRCAAYRGSTMSRQLFTPQRVSNAQISPVSSAINLETTNPNVKLMQYAVRGPLVIRAGEIEKELKQGIKKPFDRVIKANIGDCHAMGQKPITFIRQVLALILYPKLMDDPQFPEDTKKRAREILESCKGGSVGAYTDSPGIEYIRRHVAEYIQKRDGGLAADWQNVFLGSGASDCIKNVLKMLNCPVEGKTPGIMVPIPQYPLYSATIVEFGMQIIGYYLDESGDWGLDPAELERARTEALPNAYPRGLVVINPGNPTGQVLSRENIEDIIKFARKYDLFLFADEVYQDNVYNPNLQFHSFKKVLMEMGSPYNRLELASFMSVSKGYMGECGLRGGYTEIINMDADVKAMYSKSISAMLCATVIGQACVDTVICPPKPGEPSYDLWIKEKTAVLDSLKLRAKMVVDSFNALEGFNCKVVQGAMYAFPTFTLPEKAIKAAKEKGKEPDFLYALELLENTGICIVPGSGFGQKAGTYHFRTTILPQPDVLKYMLETFGKFHKDFIKRYS